MKPKNPFSIVNRPVQLTASRKIAESSVSAALKRQSKTLAIDRIPPGLMEALVSKSSTVDTLSRAKPVKQRKTKSVTATPAVLPAGVVKVIERAANGNVASTVGVLDLGSWVSRLPKLLKVMNESQDSLVFLEIQTSVPAGLIKTKEPLEKWAVTLLGRPLKKKESSDLFRNMLADEFFYFAESVRVQNKLDQIVGLTPAMIAFEDEDGPCWNYFSVGRDKASVISTFDLREYAARAGKPYEAAVGMLIAAQVLALRNDMKYHDETRGCIFDFDANRADLVESIRGMHIDAECLKCFKDQDEAKSAKSLIMALARMKETQRG